jgi:hypothetical protein
MKTYITQEQAVELAKASGFTVHRGLGLLQSVPEDVFGHGLISKEIYALCNAAIQHYRDSLVAGVVLPEPVAYFYHDAGSAETANPLLHSTMFLHRSERRQNLRNETPLYTADQLRQAIADALCVAEKETAELRLYKQNMEARFKGLNNMLADALAKQVPQWQPIETAPKPSGQVLLSAGKQTGCGHWYSTYNRWEYDGYGFGIPKSQPTHWMPLPAAPDPKKAA